MIFNTYRIRKIPISSKNKICHNKLQLSSNYRCLHKNKVLLELLNNSIKHTQVVFLYLPLIHRRISMTMLHGKDMVNCQTTIKDQLLI